jgi:hypothetical protein
VYDYAGAESPNQLDDLRPVFGVRLNLAGPDISNDKTTELLIVRMFKEKDHRELQFVHTGFMSARSGIDSKDVADATLTKVADRTYTLVPKADLKPGEYLVTFRGTNGSYGFDFGIRQRRKVR